MPEPLRHRRQRALVQQARPRRSDLARGREPGLPTKIMVAKSRYHAEIGRPGQISGIRNEASGRYTITDDGSERQALPSAGNRRWGDNIAICQTADCSSPAPGRTNPGWPGSKLGGFPARRPNGASENPEHADDAGNYANQMTEGSMTPA